MFGGLYGPAGIVGEVPQEAPLRMVDVSWRHETAAILGARLTMWLSERLGAEASIAYSPSNLKRKVAGTVDDAPVFGSTEYETKVLAAAGRGVLRFGSAQDAVRFQVLGGLGVVSRAGDVYESVEGATGLALVIGGGFRVRLAPNVLIRVDVEDYLSKVELIVKEPLSETLLVVPGTSLGSHFRSDFLFVQSLVLEL